jgi:hypothetical protein
MTTGYENGENEGRLARQIRELQNEIRSKDEYIAYLTNQLNQSRMLSPTQQQQHYRHQPAVTYYDQYGNPVYAQQQQQYHPKPSKAGLAVTGAAKGAAGGAIRGAIIGAILPGMNARGGWIAWSKEPYSVGETSFVRTYLPCCFSRDTSIVFYDNI